MAGRGLAVLNEHLVLNQEFLQEEGFCGIGPLLTLPRRPTAIFASSDLTAMACIHLIRRANLRVPEDIAVVGFDDLRISAHMEVPLTTINQPKDEIAGKAVQLLLRGLEPGAANRAPELLLVAPRLVIRDSA
jgi:DNA-binding LacI/PurR family transcriptional regulator